MGRGYSVLVGVVSLFLVQAVEWALVMGQDLAFWQGVEHQYQGWLRDVGDRVGSQEPVFSGGKSLFRRNRAARSILVDPNGGGMFTTVQAAIDSIPLGNRLAITIYIKAGTYREKVAISRYQKYITLKGQGRENTTIVWNDTAAIVNSTYKSATFAVDAPLFTAYDITFQNDAPAPDPGVEMQQAVALRIAGNYASFYRCGFLGHQDTLYDQKGKHYFKDCFIQGSIDFIFGNGLSFYENCHLDVVPKTPGFLTAQKRSKESSSTGFSFVGCSITGNGMVYLGRAYGSYSRVVYAYTYIGDVVFPEGWYTWPGKPQRNETVYYGEYKCYGPGATRTSRVPWSHELTDAEAQPFLTTNFVEGSSWIGVE